MNAEWEDYSAIKVASSKAPARPTRQPFTPNRTSSTVLMSATLDRVEEKSRFDKAYDAFKESSFGKWLMKPATEDLPA